MSVLNEFAADEQLLLMEGPRLGAVAVAAASLGRKRETASEGFAAAEYILKSRGDYLDNALVSSILFEIEKRSASGAKFADFSELARAPGAKDAALVRLQQLAELLDNKVDPAEAAGYKQWVINAAVRTSEAGIEDAGFFSRGSIVVNEAETEALAQVSAALGMA